MAKIIGYVVVGALGLFVIRALGFVFGIIVAAILVPIIQILVTRLFSSKEQRAAMEEHARLENEQARLANEQARLAKEEARLAEVAAATAKIDFALHERATSELDSGSLKRELWEQSLADSAGDHNIARTIYVRLRKAELVDEQELASAEQERLESLKPKGRCPNCKTVIQLDSEHCPNCKATFGSGSAWVIAPLTSAERTAARPPQSRHF